MHQSFVTTAPPPPPTHTYGEGWGVVGLKCKTITLRVSSQCRGNDGVLTLGSLPQRDFLLRRAGQRAKFLPPVCLLGGGAHSRALKAEKLLSPPFPVGGGAVLTNDWCMCFSKNLIWLHKMFYDRVKERLKCAKKGPEIYQRVCINFSTGMK